MKSLIQKTFVAVGLLTVATFAAAAPQKIEHLPRVVITGKAVTQASQQVVQLPRVVVEGRSLLSQRTQLAMEARRAARRG
ncbi:hypothetical protein [Pelomonas sp. SE-A7]|uniref:hypothetical protein n=1 Tax=Pelomonas sp. SE-A7 TaxID=3054953 RepID=UPI00259C99C6|nr:hypothetical protein [Pelomonas sp. SE-A7]MDM4767041.1 hypothetical protein [Pelomonas sp. SE-A7]